MSIYIDFSRFMPIYHVDLCQALPMSVEVADGGTLPGRYQSTPGWYWLRLLKVDIGQYQVDNGQYQVDNGQYQLTPGGYQRVSGQN